MKGLERRVNGIGIGKDEGENKMEEQENRSLEGGDDYWERGR